MRLRIVEPCHEAWDSFEVDVHGASNVRRCNACDRHVHDLAGMTERASVAYAMLHGRDGMCARLRVAPAACEPRSFALTSRSTLAAATLSAMVGCATSSPPSDVVIAPAVMAPASRAPVIDGPATTCEPAATPPTSTAPSDVEPKVVVVVMGRMGPAIERVRYAHNAVKPLRESVLLLTEVAHVLRDHVDIKKVRVIGSAAANERDAASLSVRRAQLVVEALVAHGVAIERLEVRGDGVTRPLADNRTAEGRAKNRNVTFEIIEPL